jgi:hypothetical protein
MADQTQADEKVGHKRPPKHAQFRKGRSGNPKGRPRKTQGLGDMLATTLAERVSVTTRGKRRSMTRGAALAHQLLDKVAGGDARLLQTLFRELLQREARDREESERREWLEERTALCEEIARLKRRNDELDRYWALRYADLQLADLTDEECAEAMAAA